MRSGSAANLLIAAFLRCW